MGAPRNAVYAEESAEVEVLYADLEKLNTLTKRIQGSLSRLEASGKVVKNAIGPIYGNTQALHATNTNIDRVNDAIERMRRPLDVKGQEESIIRAGYGFHLSKALPPLFCHLFYLTRNFYRPQNAGLPQFIGALKRIDLALTDLSATKLRSNQKAVSEFSSLLSSGSSKLQDLFHSTLRAEANTIEPLHYLTKRELLYLPLAKIDTCNFTQLIFL